MRQTLVDLNNKMREMWAYEIITQYCEPLEAKTIRNQAIIGKARQLLHQDNDVN